MTGIAFGRGELPKAPWEIQEEVELFARKSGRTGKVHFIPNVGWMARFSLRPNDKRMRLYQEGRAERPPTEDVYFRVRDAKTGQAVPLDILEMGASGVREFLEKGDTWSGRGQFSSLKEEQKTKKLEAEELTRKNKEDARDQARQMVKDQRRTRFKIPFIGVGIDLKKD